MNKFEKQSKLEKQNLELKPDTKVRVVAILEDIGGARYFLKTDQGQYFFLNQDKDHYEWVSEETVASAIIKYGYKPVAGGKFFEFGQRKEVLKE